MQLRSWAPGQKSSRPVAFLATGQFQLDLKKEMNALIQACNFTNKTNSLLADPLTSAKKWWGIAKSQYGNKWCSSIPDLLENDNVISDSRLKAQVFNDYFVSQSVLLSAATAAIPSLPSWHYSLSFIAVNESQVLNILYNLDISKACGFDNISNKTLKLCANGIFKPLTCLINFSLFSGKYPMNWKMANVIPLFKKENRQLKLNYRPVSLLVSLSKVCEKLVFIDVYKFLENTGFFYPFQCGFRPGDSTVMQLVYIVHKFTKLWKKVMEYERYFLIFLRLLIKSGIKVYLPN